MISSIEVYVTVAFDGISLTLILTNKRTVALPRSVTTQSRGPRDPWLRTLPLCHPTTSGIVVYCIALYRLVLLLEHVGRVSALLRHRDEGVQSPPVVVGIGTRAIRANAEDTVRVLVDLPEELELLREQPLRLRIWRFVRWCTTQTHHTRHTG